MEQKLYPCNECGRKVPIRSKGKCGICRQRERKQEGTLPIYNKPIKKTTTKNSSKRKKERGCLPAFFQYHIEELSKNPFSIESGDRIYNPSAMHICHLLPKRKAGGFPSIQCHMDNVVYMTVDEHTKFDKLLDHRDYLKIEQEFPNSWAYICKQLKKLLKIATEVNKMSLSLEEYLSR